jgi:hypothetical protein
MAEMLSCKMIINDLRTVEIIQVSPSVFELYDVIVKFRELFIKCDRDLFIKEFTRLHPQIMFDCYPSRQEFIIMILKTLIVQEGKTIGLVISTDVFQMDEYNLKLSDCELKLATLVTNKLFEGTLDIEYVKLILNIVRKEELRLYCETIYPELYKYITF